jgi:uncharacterized protein (TIGR00369 family)
MMEDRGQHWRKLERLYLSAPINAYYRPLIRIRERECEIEIEVRPDFHHAAHAVHGSVYFKMLDDAGFFAANSVVGDSFVLTADFTLHFLRPVTDGTLTAKGRLIHAGSRQLVAEAQLFDGDGQLVAHGVGTYVRGRIALNEDVGY